MDGSNGDVDGVVSRFRWDYASIHQFPGNYQYLRGEVEQRDGIQQCNPPLCHLSLTTLTFVQDSLRADQIVVAPVLVPPDSRKPLPGRFNQ